jgi:tetratricopeptide (TPR) repeat protein
VRADVDAAFSATALPYAADTAKFVHGALDAYASDWAEARTSACRDASANPDDAAALTRERCLDARLASLRVLGEDFASADPNTVENAVDLVLALPPVESCAADRASSAVPADQQIEIAETLAHAYALYVRDQRARSRELAQQTLELTRALGDAANEARALIALARLERSEGKADESSLWAAWAAAERSQDPRSIVESQVELAGAIKDQKTRLAEAQGLLDVARIRLEPLDEPLLRARVASGLASIAFARGDYDQGVDEAEEAIEIIEARFGPNHPELVEFLARLASAQAESGHFAAAVGTWERARTVAEQSLGPSHPTALFVLGGLANLEWGRANLDAATGHARTCVETAEHAYGPDHVLVASCADRLGMILGAKGEHEAAIEALRRAVAIERGRDPVEPKTLSLRLGHLAAALRSAGRPEDALAEIDAVVEIQREHFPVGHGNRTLGLEKRARILLQLDRPEDALRDFEEIVETSVGTLDRVTSPNVLGGMGEAMVAVGRTEDGIDLLERALALTEGYEPTDTRRADAQFGLAQAIVDRDRPRARDLARSARDIYARQSEDNENYRRISAWIAIVG